MDKKEESLHVSFRILHVCVYDAGNLPWQKSRRRSKPESDVLYQYVWRIADGLLPILFHPQRRFTKELINTGLWQLDIVSFQDLIITVDCVCEMVDKIIIFIHAIFIG